MTTHKKYHKPSEKVTYSRPVVGPRVYLVKGPSGWSESFDRKASDKAMLAFLAPLAVNTVLEAFLQHLKIEGARAISWSDVTGYLGRITQSDPDNIADAVGVAFWAHTMMFEEQLKMGAN